MDTHFLPHDHLYLMSEYATAPSALFLQPQAALQKLGIVGYAELLRLARVCKNSTLGRVQLPFLG